MKQTENELKSKRTKNRKAIIWSLCLVIDGMIAMPLTTYAQIFNAIGGSGDSGGNTNALLSGGGGGGGKKINS